MKNWYFITWVDYFYNNKNSDYDSEDIHSEPFYGSEEDLRNYISEKSYSNDDETGGVGFERGQGSIVKGLWLLTPQGNKEEKSFSK